jgi:hypothetical protein
MKDKRLCKHLPCTCGLLLPGDEYCSDFCRKADEETGKLDAHCHCMHPDCGGEPQVPVETESLLIASAALAEA